MYTGCARPTSSWTGVVGNRRGLWSAPGMGFRCAEVRSRLRPCERLTVDGKWPFACCVPAVADPDSGQGATARLLRSRTVRLPTIVWRRMHPLGCLTLLPGCLTSLWSAISLLHCRMARATSLPPCRMRRCCLTCLRRRRMRPGCLTFLRGRPMSRVTSLPHCRMARATSLLRRPMPRLKCSRLRQMARSALSAVELLATWWSMASSPIRRSADA